MITSVLLLAFLRVGLVDSFDFARNFDIETTNGTEQVAAHVLSRGANVLWWRTNGGAILRYPSKEEPTPYLQRPFGKLRVHDQRRFFGQLRLDRGETNLVVAARDWCRRKGVPFGIHMSYEENHSSASYIGEWNTRHPEYWCRPKSGTPWPGRTSMTYPEVFARKLRIVAEQLDMEPEWFYVDFFRSGGWTPAYEYVEPMTDKWRKLYKCEPPDDATDERWVRLFEPYQTSFFRSIKKMIRERGGKTKLCVSLNYLDSTENPMWEKYALDWRKLAAEGTIDVLVVASVKPAERPPRKEFWDYMRRIYQSVMDSRGKAEVMFSCSMYNYQPGIPSYIKWSGDKRPVVAQKLLDLAKEVGGTGVILECVDYPNYPDDVVNVLESFK